MTVPTTLAAPAATRPAHPHRYIHPTELVHTRPIGPVDPARINPNHLPALAHTPTDLDNITAPVRVVPAADLGVCVECCSGRDNDLPVLDAVVVVVATDAYGYVSRDEVCGLHLHPTVDDHARVNHLVTVEAPAQGRGHHRDHAVTWYADGPVSGVAVRRVWDAWAVLDLPVTGEVVELARIPDGGDWEAARVRAEVLAQAVASQRATDAAYLADTIGVAA